MSTQIIPATIAVLDGWQYAPEESNHRIYVVKPDPDYPLAPRFSLQLNSSGDRITVSGCYPTDRLYQDPPEPYITCDKYRGPTSIAGDITRRFLPRFLELHQIRAHRLATHQETHNQLQQLNTEIVTLLNTTADTQIARFEPTTPRNRNLAKIWLHADLDAGHLSGDISLNPNSLDIHLHSIPHHIGKVLLKTLAIQVKQHRRIHISEIPEDQRTNTYLPLINLWDDPYHSNIITAAQQLTTQHPEHTWRYIAQSSTTIWVAVDDDNLRISLIYDPNP